MPCSAASPVATSSTISVQNFFFKIRCVCIAPLYTQLGSVTTATLNGSISTTKETVLFSAGVSAIGCDTICDAA